MQHGQASPAVASGAFGIAHARAVAARAATAREQRAWVVDPLRAHVGIAFVDASEALRAYETALADVKLQHAHARKLEAKGERKASEAQAARAKLAAMSARIAPQAERVHSKLSLLVRKQEGDFDKWVAKMSKSERKLADETRACVPQQPAWFACGRRDGWLSLTRVRLCRDAASRAGRSRCA